MIVEYHPAARVEFRRAAQTYEQDRPGLGLAFLLALREAEATIIAHPDIGTPLGSNRRYLIRRFPYGIIYRREAARLYVIAVAHNRRRPEYWLHRQ